MSNRNRSLRESSQQSGSSRPNGYVLSAGVRNTLFFVLGWLTFVQICLYSGMWTFDGTQWDMIIATGSVLMPISTIVMIYILYDREQEN